MRIYNFLFYKSFIAAKKSKNFDDTPVLGGLVFLGMCVSLNIFTIIGFLEGLNISTIGDFLVKYKWIFSFGLLGLLLFYYSYKDRYKKIIESYENKYSWIMKIPAAIVIIFYILVSFGLLLLAGLFKNKDWIFAVL